MSTSKHEFCGVAAGDGDSDAAGYGDVWLIQSPAGDISKLYDSYTRGNMNKQKFLEEYSDQEFLDFCRLVAGRDFNEDLTDERIEAANVVRANPHYVTWRLLEICGQLPAKENRQ